MNWIELVDEKSTVVTVEWKLTEKRLWGKLNEKWMKNGLWGKLNENWMKNGLWGQLKAFEMKNGLCRQLKKTVGTLGVELNWICKWKSLFIEYRTLNWILQTQKQNKNNSKDSQSNKISKTNYITSKTN